jgi:hypothetical protein
MVASHLRQFVGREATRPNAAACQCGSLLEQRPLNVKFQFVAITLDGTFAVTREEILYKQFCN